ncbi:hypothetical protein C2S51_014917 [Perilla frutescens var. frutescens]|nr:hypothetical protein C2S51_014917 [Perilla frutescens var. frutescens]
MPFSHYTGGKDSLSLTIAVSDSDFCRLTSNDHSRDAAEFHDFLPTLPPATYSSDSIKFSVTAVRITLFPNHGICIGLTNHHAICDGSNLIGPSGLIQTWASISKFNRDSHLSRKMLPSYDRSTVEGAADLTTVFWNHVTMFSPPASSTLPPPAFNVRGTFVLTEVEIRTFKKFLENQNPTVGHVSSYVAVCAHVWSCLAEAAAAAGERVDEDEPEYLSVSVDCRGRLTPPLPQTYLDNCLVFVLAQSTHEQLKGKKGLVVAARVIAAAISKTVDGEGGVLVDAEENYLRRWEVAEKRLIGVAGSPKFDLHSVDFGWGGFRKFEVIHIDYNGAMSLTMSKQGGIEVGLSMPKPKMDAFATIFNKNLCIMNSSL